MISFQHAFKGAGLVPVINFVNLKNMRLDSFKGRQSQTETLLENPTELKINFLYFWEPSCDNCIDTLKQLDTIASSNRHQNINFQLIAVQDSEITQAQFLFDQLQLKSKLWWDRLGAVTERLAVFGVPGAVVIDADGNLLARVNGAVEVQTPGFDVLLKLIDDAVTNVPPVDIRQSMLSEIATPAVPAALPDDKSGMDLALGSSIFIIFIILILVFCILIFRNKKDA